MGLMEGFWKTVQCCERTLRCTGTACPNDHGQFNRKSNMFPSHLRSILFGACRKSNDGPQGPVTDSSFIDFNASPLNLPDSRLSNSARVRRTRCSTPRWLECSLLSGGDWRNCPKLWTLHHWITGLTSADCPVRSPRGWAG